MKNLSFNESGDCLTAYLSGELDHHIASCVRESIDEYIYRLRPDTFVLDISGTDFMDSSGLGLIMGRLMLCRSINCMFYLSGADERAKRILSLSGMDKAVALKLPESEEAVNPNPDIQSNTYKSVNIKIPKRKEQG